MGKGDKKTRRGKIASKTYGVRRPKKDEKGPAKPDAKK
jgi:30S ribosomal protein S31